MRTVRIAVEIILVLGLLAGCQSEVRPVMPMAVGQRLDLALADIKRAGFDDDVEVVGGGLFGVVDKSNWTVCAQQPPAGEEISNAPRLTVDRTCKENIAQTPPPSLAAPSATGATIPTSISDSRSPQSAQPSAVPSTCVTVPGSKPCKFGQTAVYSDTVRSGEVNLEITVGRPIKFKPSPNASIPYNLPFQAVNVYFPVTIKNASSKPSPRDTLLLTEATNKLQGPGDGIRDVYDGDIVGAAAGVSELAPGEAVSFKQGFSMETLEGIKYSLAIDGLAGYTVRFEE